MALYDIRASLSAPAQGTFQSGASNSQSLNLNPAFQFGGGTQTSTPSGASDANVAPTQVATPTDINTPFAGGGVPGVPGVVLPSGVASPFGTTTSGSSFWIFVLLIGGALLLAGRDHRRRSMCN